MRHAWLALLITAMVGFYCRQADANGRFPATRHVVLNEADEVVLAPATFGLLIAEQEKTFRWVCEEALGYSGTYDPTYVLAGEAFWLTTFDGVRVSRDGGCTWQVVGAPFDELFPGDMTVDGTGAIWVATAQAGKQNGVYRNAAPNQGTSFVATGLAVTDAVLTSIAVSDDGMTVYVAGFELPGDPLGDPTALLMRSTDGGVMWTTLSTADFSLGSDYQIYIEAIDAADSSIVLVRVPRAGGGGDALHVSRDGGDSFVLGVQVDGTIEDALVRENGDLVVGAGAEGVLIAASGSSSFVAQPAGIQLGCLAQTSDGTLVGCGNNWAPDLAALATSADGNEWTQIARFSDIAGPLECDPGTVQQQVCAEELWPGLQEQLGMEPGTADAGADAGATKPSPTDGCGCQSSRGWDTLVAVSVILLFAGATLRRRVPPKPSRGRSHSAS